MKSFITILFLFYATLSNASSISNVKVKKLAINSQYGDFVFIELESDPERIACSINGGWDYTLSLTSETHKAMYSMLLAAHMSQRAISISGLSVPSCNEFPSIESAATIYIH